MSAFQTQWTQFTGWLFREQHKQQAREISARMQKVFTEHPQAGGETYWEHLLFTLKITTRLMFSSVALLIHGIFPFLFTRTTSIQVEKIWAIMRSRITQQRREEIIQTWHI